MDTASTLIGLGLLAVFVLPILYLIWQQHNKEKNRLKKLKKISTKNNLNADIVEVSSGLILGLDSKAKKLIVIEPGPHMPYQVLDLTQVKNSTLHSPPFPDHQKISLHLSGSFKNHELIEIVFYDQDDNQNNDVWEWLMVAKKWERIISEKLSA